MAHYNVLHVEDDPDIRDCMEGPFTRRELSYDGCESLKELEERLPQNTYDLFLIDGNFLDEPGGSVALNFPKAAALIKEYFENPVIYMLSDITDGNVIAEVHGAEFLGKNSCSPADIAEMLKEKLKSN
ncbi:hypothetical protein KY332_01295 [Candidatus Woesearchaeota archaeon]|nr:hypothetical protein [Candidatus Woesearchaeota archaeon]